MANEPKKENEVKTTSQPIDPNSLLQGYLVGCRLRAMRGKAPDNEAAAASEPVPVYA